jgi:hypothetical protein
MKPKLTSISILESFSGVQTIRLDFDNDRHHASIPIHGDRDDIAEALMRLAANLKRDENLDSPNTPVSHGLSEAKDVAL